jgi:hypothetical protein
MRTTNMPAWIAKFPTEWQNAMKSVDIVTAATYNGTSNEITSDKMYLLAAKEVFGGTATTAGTATAYSNLTEFNALTQSAWYAANNTDANRVKKQPATGSACYWWERSPYYTTSTGFCYVGTDGSAGSSGASAARGVSPGFCV